MEKRDMTTRVARKKSLFTVPSSPEDPPELLGGSCTCGHLFFPPHRYGCEVCGGDEGRISIVKMPARGVIKSYAVAHLQNRPAGRGPLVVGEVLLDAGPCVTAVLDSRDENKLTVGGRVSGKLVSVGEESGRVIVDCVFAPEGGDA
jgi:uncharacterized OB-fold protein